MSPKTGNSEGGTSPVVGTITLVTVVITVSGTVGYMATNLETPTDPPFLELDFEEGNEGEKEFYLYHVGGDSIPVNEISLKTENSTLSDLASVSYSGSDNVFDPGERIEVDNTEFSGSIEVKIVHPPSNSLLAKSEINISRGKRAIWNVTENPVYEGENRAYYPTVTKIENYHMWYTDKKSGKYVIRKTVSDDGKSWEDSKLCENLTGTPNHSVVVNTGPKESPVYRIWYFDAYPRAEYDENAFRTAFSTDGIHWENDTQCENLFDGGVEGDWYSSYGPGDVIYNQDGYNTIDHSDPMGNKFVMYYDIATMNINPSETEVTAMAYSADGIHWHRYGNESIIKTGESGTWDDNYVYVRSVIETEDGYEAWYSGGAKSSHEGIGNLTSEDGINWARDDKNPVLYKDDPNAPEWRDERTYTPSVLLENGVYKMWFSGEYVIGYATK